MRPHRLKELLFTTLLTLLLSVPLFAEEPQRHCVGLLWCTETGDGTVTTDLLWGLYASEQRGTYSRLVLRPLFAAETDPSQDLLRRSVLWPLGEYRRLSGEVQAYVFPLYWHGDNPSNRYTYVLPLYFDQERGDQSSLFIAPFYFAGKNPRSSMQWLLPLYFAGESYTTSESYRIVVPFYGSDESPDRRYHFLFPLYSQEIDRTQRLSRLSLVGLPELPHAYHAPAVSLYEHVSRPDAVSDRLTPLYRYAHDEKTETWNLDILGVGSWSLYENAATPEHRHQHLLPFLSYDRDPSTDGTIVRLLGVDRLSLYAHASTPKGTDDQFFPLYEYEGHADSWSLSGLGLSHLSFYRRDVTAHMVTDRFFPLYRYSHDKARDDVRLDAALLYRHVAAADHLVDRLLPLWEYERTDVEADHWRLDVVGSSSMALYHHGHSPERTTDHLFPFYGYSASDEDRHVSALGFPPQDGITLALYDHHRTSSLTADRLFPLYRMTKDKAAGLSELDVLFAFHHRVTGQSTDDRLTPLYAYHVDGGSTSLHLLGFPDWSLYEHRKEPSRLRDRFFPLYSYDQDRSGNVTVFTALLLYGHEHTATGITDRFVPLYSYRADVDAHTGDFSLLGFDPLVPVSLYKRHIGPNDKRTSLFPLFTASDEGRTSTFSVLGSGDLSLYRRETTPARFQERFFPFYAHTTDRESGTETSWLLLHHHVASPTRTTDRSIPFWDYSSDHTTGVTDFRMIGLGEVSLYHHAHSPARTTDRLFPLYTYEADSQSGKAQFDLLWPLVVYRRDQGRTTEASLLWWLASYEQADETQHDFRLLGGSRMAVVRRSVDPERSTFEINPILPLYLYRTDVKQGTSWNVLGGFLGKDSTEAGSKIRLLWMTL